ncbi:MAG: hypothetical protein QM802_02235 [Agriterribacter sp.]
MFLIRPVQNTWTYKEIWVHPVTRWLWLLKDVAGAAMVEGLADSTVTFTDASGGSIHVEPDAGTRHFRKMLPEGTYTVAYNGQVQTQTFLPSGSYHLDLTAYHAVAFEVNTTKTKNEITITVKAKGEGNHHFTIRTDNLKLTGNAKQLVLKPGVETVLQWKATIAANDEPWVAVVFPDNNLSQRKEIKEAAWDK